MTLLIGSLQLGFLYSIMVLGIYISFRILNIPDLTTEGSFTFGLAASSILTAAGHPLLGLVGALIAGALAGSVTGFLQTKLDIHPVLAGILTMSGLYSINLFVMGGASNVTLLNNDTVFTLFLKVFPFMSKDAVKLFVAIAAVVIVTVLLTVFFKTSLGLSIRATGDNADMVRASSINVDAVKMIALAISNACIAFCGGCRHQFRCRYSCCRFGFCDYRRSFLWSQKSDDRVYFSHCGFHYIPLYYCSGNKIRYVPGVHAEIDFGNYCDCRPGCSGNQS